MDRSRVRGVGSRGSRSSPWGGRLVALGLLLGTLGTVPASEFRLTTRTEVLSAAYKEGGEVTVYVLQVGTNAYQFYAPKGWGVRSEPATRRVNFLETNLLAVIALQLGTNPPAGGLDPGELRTRALARHPGYQVVREFRCGSGFGEGLAFDLVEPGESSGRGASRTAFVPLPAGMAEFDLRSSLVLITNYYRPLTRLMGSLRSAGLPAGGGR